MVEPHRSLITPRLLSFEEFSTPPPFIQTTSSITNSIVHSRSRARNLYWPDSNYKIFFLLNKLTWRQASFDV